MQTLFLMADVLALVALGYGIYRIVSAARRRAEENRSPTEADRPSVSDQQRVVDLKTRLEFAKEASPATIPDWHEERPPEIMAPPVALAAASSDLAHPAIEEDLPYADPIDGMPFEAEEAVVPCVCGLAYREDSVAWLAEYHAGCCIHCGAKVDLPKPGS